MNEEGPAQSSTRITGRIRAGAAVVMALLALLAVALAVVLGADHAGAVLLGALGWFVALAARLPVLGSAGRLHALRRRETIIALVSGATDEVVRLAVVLVAVSGVESALWAGFGWALAQLVFTAATELPKFSWPVGRQASEQLKAQGGFVSTHPLHSAVRGVTAISFHLGATLLLSAGLWWVAVTASAHVLVNIGFARWAGKRLVAVEVFAVVVGAVVLVAGLTSADVLG
ncbi:hypothetical protein [Lentzea albida]|uniref:Uncharacterized protein n=1 Tax=Lentzea albida TaxID=65499 RepID=A0A1H9XB37_9PSEU|nr:hypothetical protein [Lentzea albida]SES43416.1 hypothetical protein SAMN04488000_13151 [Lentzea albida]